MQAEIQAGNPYATFGQTVAQAQPSERVAFIRKTYIHLAAAVYAFVALCWFAQTALPLDAWIGQLWMNRWFPLILIGGFIAVSWIANAWAHSNTSVGLQYAGLGLYVLAQSVIFTPLLYVAKQYSVDMGFGGMNVISAAALITLVIFGALTAAVFITGKDFSFLRTALVVGSVAAFALILAGMLMGFDLPALWFAGAMILLASGYILYDTSNVMHHYRTTQHVAASLALFAAVALLFYYILIFVLQFANRD